MQKGLLSMDFAKAFSQILEETHVSCYQISQFSNIDEGYLSRLKSGEKCNPSLETIMKICLALAHLSKELQLNQVEDLLNSAGRSLRIKS